MAADAPLAGRIHARPMTFTRRWARRLLGVLGLAGMGGVGLVLLAAPAGAQVQGPCAATIKGISANQATTPKTAIDVDESEDVRVAGTASSGPVQYKIALRFYLPIVGDTSWTVKKGTSNDNTWGDTVNVSNYAKYGTGLYLVHAVAGFGGQTCRADAFVNVTGKSPATTPAGIGAAAAGLGGAAAVAGATAVAAREGRSVEDAINSQADDRTPDWMEQQLEGNPSADPEGDRLRKKVVKTIADPFRVCAPLALGAFLLTVTALLGDAGRAVGGRFRGSDR
jgi:hypothetical protein